MNLLLQKKALTSTALVACSLLMQSCLHGMLTPKTSVLRGKASLIHNYVRCLPTVLCQLTGEYTQDEWHLKPHISIEVQDRKIRDRVKIICNSLPFLPAILHGLIGKYTEGRKWRSKSNITIQYAHRDCGPIEYLYPINNSDLHKQIISCSDKIILYDFQTKKQCVLNVVRESMVYAPKNKLLVGFILRI